MRVNIPFDENCEVLLDHTEGNVRDLPYKRIQVIDHSRKPSHSSTLSSASTLAKRASHHVSSIRQESHSQKSFYRPVKNFGFTNHNLYVDNEGELHGPMDKKHSINLAGIHKLGHEYNYHQESNRNLYQSSNRPISANLDGLLTDLDRLRKTNAERVYKSSFSHENNHHNTMNTGNMSKWSSWTNHNLSPSPNRYATTVTRQNVKATPQTVEVVVKRPPSLGASRVDITDNSRPFYRSSSTHMVQNDHSEIMSHREKLLIDELLETKRELQNIKRSQSQIGIQTPDNGARMNGSQYFNEMWSTRSLKKTEGPPNWKMQTSPRPIRTVSQTNILSQPARISNNWTSETNIRGNIGKTGYSAHRENAQNVALNEFQNRESYSARNHLDGKYYEELEVITLQPIGKGVQDLHSGSYISTLPRSVGFRSGQQSPSISNFNRQKFTYESSTNDIRTKAGTGKSYVSPQVAVTQISQQNTSYVSSGHMNGQSSDGQDLGVRAALDSQNIWYQPEISREQVIDILQNEDAGSFIIRKSTTFANSYGLALKVPKLSNRMIDQNDDRGNELVRHFLIEGVDGGVHLRGFSNEAVFKTLSHFVHHHTQQKDALPCCLKLPNTPASGAAAMAHGANSNFTMGRSGSVGSREFHNYMRANSQVEQLDRNRGIKFDLVYLGNVMVDRLCEDAGVRKATTELLAQYERGHAMKKSTVNIEVIPNDGIYIHDAGRGNIKKFIKASDFEWVGYDPELRTFSDRNLTGLSDARIIGIVSQKNKIILHENSAHIFCEVNPSKTDYIINYIKMNMMKR